MQEIKFDWLRERTHKKKNSEGSVWILISYYSIKINIKKNTQDEEYKLNSVSRRRNKPTGKREGL